MITTNPQQIQNSDATVLDVSNAATFNSFYSCCHFGQFIQFNIYTTSCNTKVMFELKKQNNDHALEKKKNSVKKKKENRKIISLKRYKINRL